MGGCDAKMVILRGKGSKFVFYYDMKYKQLYVCYGNNNRSNWLDQNTYSSLTTYNKQKLPMCSYG